MHAAGTWIANCNGCWTVFPRRCVRYGIPFCVVHKTNNGSHEIMFSELSDFSYSGSGQHTWEEAKIQTRLTCQRHGKVLLIIRTLILWV